MGLTPPATQYAQSGDVHVAYQLTGSGEIDMVLAPGTVSHLGLDWQRPERVEWIERLSSILQADPLRQARHRALRPAAERRDARGTDG